MRPTIASSMDTTYHAPIKPTVRQRWLSHDDASADMPPSATIRPNKLSVGGMKSDGETFSDSWIVLRPIAVPHHTALASSALPRIVTKACVAYTDVRRTGCASSISIVPRPISPLTQSDPRATAQAID